MKINRRGQAALALITAGATALLSSPVWAGIGRPASDAQAILAKLEAADQKLQSAKSVRATFTRTDTYEGKYQDVRQTGELWLARPGQVRLAITRARRADASEPWKDTGNNTLSVSNGKDAYYAFSHPFSTQVRHETPKDSPSIDEVPLVSAFYSGKTSIPALIRRLTAEGKVKNLSESGGEIRFSEGDRIYRIQLNAQSLVSQIEIESLAKRTRQSWVLDSVELDPELSAEAFSYKVPENAIPFDPKVSGGPLEVGSLAPDVTLTGADGKLHSLAEFRGKAVVLEFFATWCYSCNKGFPHLAAVAKQSPGVETIAVAIRGSRADFDSWTQRHPEYRHVRFAFESPTTPEASTKFNVSATPTTYVIGPTGVIVAAFTGFRGPSDDLQKAIEKASKPPY